MVNCTACTKAIRTSAQHIKCSKCTGTYHHICVNLPDTKKVLDEIKLSWVCPMCTASAPKRDNTNTPVRATALTATSRDELTVATQSYPPATSPSIASPLLTNIDSDSLSSLTLEMRLLREDIREIKSHMKALTEHISKCNSRLDEFEKNAARTEDRLRVVEAHGSVIIQLQSTIAELHSQQRSRAQAALKNEIEICGIDELPNENSQHIIRLVAQKIGFSLDGNDLDYVERVGPRHRGVEGGITQVKDAPNKQPRPLVVRFLRRHQRDEFLKAGKSRRNLNNTDILDTGNSRSIYFNERLTHDNRYLFRSARHRCKGSGFKYCWIKNGTVHVRKQEGNPAVTIKNMDDLLRCVDPFPDS